MRAPALALAAAAVLMAEAIALFVFAALEVLGLAAGDVASVPTAVALTVLTVVGALALGAFAIGTRRGRSWARSGGIVFQVLAVALAVAALTLAPVPWTFVLALGLPGVLCFALLIASTRSEGAGRTG